MPRSRWFRGLAIGLPIVLVLAYVGASFYVYNQLSEAKAKCAGATDLGEPDSFQLATVDTTPYLMPEFEDVRFPSHDSPGITIAAFWIPSAVRADAPAVIVSHGHNGCRRNPPNLLIAGMLHRAGFAVLMIDLRDHGDSTIEDGRFAGGTDEQLDVRGGIDWLIARDAPPETIGIIGFSLGAATAITAFGEDDRLAALWEDSGFADVREAIRDELRRNNYPTILEAGGILIGQLNGDDFTAYSPLDEVGKAHGRPVFITHGEADTRLGVKFAYELAEKIRATGGTVEPWILPGVGHTKALTVYPGTYDAKVTAFFRESLGAP
jgi:dipeptidyl aminopeptidase/acylaminoacyl peptidase